MWEGTNLLGLAEVTIGTVYVCQYHVKYLSVGLGGCYGPFSKERCSCRTQDQVKMPMTRFSPSLASLVEMESFSIYLSGHKVFKEYIIPQFKLKVLTFSKSFCPNCSNCRKDLLGIVRGATRVWYAAVVFLKPFVHLYILW